MSSEYPSHSFRQTMSNRDLSDPLQSTDEHLTMSYPAISNVSALGTTDATWPAHYGTNTIIMTGIASI